MNTHEDMPQDIYSALKERVTKGPMPVVAGEEVIYGDQYVRVTARLRLVKVTFLRVVDNKDGRPTEVPRATHESVTFTGPVSYQLGQIMRQRHEAAESRVAALRVEHLRQTLKDY